jgi:hypothetical protein
MKGVRIAQWWNVAASNAVSSLTTMRNAASKFVVASTVTVSAWSAGPEFVSDKTHEATRSYVG